MKIWWQSRTPIHRLDDYRNALVAHLDGVKRGETQIRVSGVDEGSMDRTQRRRRDEQLCARRSAEQDHPGSAGGLRRGGDRVFLDPALQEAREVVAIPVFGLGETSMLAACMYGHKFSGVAFHSKPARYYDRKAFKYRSVERGTCPSAISESTSGKFRTRSQTRRR